MAEGFLSCFLWGDFMLTASLKTTRTKIIGTICVILALIIAVILFFGGDDAGNAAESVSRHVTDNEGRIGYIASKGFETAQEPFSVEEVILPEEMDEILSEYNQSQLEAGFDLSPYLGKRVRKYVYLVEGMEDTFATLYIYDNRIIAADIASHTEGWQRPIDGGENIG